MKFPLGNLNPGPYPLHPTNTYTYEVTTAPKMHSGKSVDITKKSKTIKPLLEHVRTKSHCYDKFFIPPPPTPSLFNLYGVYNNR